MTSVYIRKRKGADGKLHLYLDYYPALFNPITRTTRKHESLKMYIYNDPKDDVERNYNQETLRLAEAVRCKRSIAIMKGELDFIEESFAKSDFLEFFSKLAERHNDSWVQALGYFSRFMNGKCRFENLTVPLAEEYKEWLLKESKGLGNHRKRKPSQNTVAKYYLVFRAVLKTAYKGKFIRENINDYLENIPLKKTKREFLTIDEIQALSKAECMYDVLKRAGMFSILTGLRFSDVQSLRWEEICKAPDGKPCIRKRIKKTDSEETVYISDQALQYCGPRMKSGEVFEYLTKSMLQYPLKTWLKNAGITKKISFHCFRHTYATLLISSGVDIYTVSKQLTHTNVKTTEIYLHIVDNRKRIAADAAVVEDIKCDVD